MRRVLLVVLLGSATAAAEPSVPAAPPRPLERSPGSPDSAEGAPRFAFGVNVPIGWGEAASIGASLFVGVTGHDAIRANVATYRNDGSLLGLVFAAAGESDGDEASYSGRTTDLGLAWTRYPRTLWSGILYELGVLRRARDTRVQDEFADPQIVATHTQAYAARLHVGWSWLIEQHIVISAAVGASVGYETGTETFDDVIDPMPTTYGVSRVDVAGEAYLRFGFAL